MCPSLHAVCTSHYMISLYYTLEHHKYTHTLEKSESARLGLKFEILDYEGKKFEISQVTPPELTCVTIPTLTR